MLGINWRRSCSSDNSQLISKGVRTVRCGACVCIDVRGQMNECTRLLAASNSRPEWQSTIVEPVTDNDYITIQTNSSGPFVPMA